MYTKQLSEILWGRRDSKTALLNEDDLRVIFLALMDRIDSIDKYLALSVEWLNASDPDSADHAKALDMCVSWEKRKGQAREVLAKVSALQGMKN